MVTNVSEFKNNYSAIVAIKKESKNKFWNWKTMFFKIRFTFYFFEWKKKKKSSSANVYLFWSRKRDVKHTILQTVIKVSPSSFIMRKLLSSTTYYVAFPCFRFRIFAGVNDTPSVPKRNSPCR